MLPHKSRSARGEIIHVRNILAELWSLTLRIFTHFSLSSQLLLHCCIDLNETWQGCCTTSLEVHVGEMIYVWNIMAELWPLTLRIFTHFSLSSQLLLHCCIDLNETWQGCCTTSLEVHVGEMIYVWNIMAELWPLTLRIFTHFSLSSQLLLYCCMDLNESWQECCTTSLGMHVGK